MKGGRCVLNTQVAPVHRLHDVRTQPIQCPPLPRRIPMPDPPANKGALRRLLVPDWTRTSADTVEQAGNRPGTGGRFRIVRGPRNYYSGGGIESQFGVVGT